MNKTAIWITAIVAVAAVVVFCIWSSNNRYYITTNSRVCDGIQPRVIRNVGRHVARWTAETPAREEPLCQIARMD